MPDTRSKKPRDSPHKALKTPRHKQKGPGSPNPAKSGKKRKGSGSSRMDRMEEQIAALTSLITAQMAVGTPRGRQQETTSSSPEASPPRKGGKPARRSKAFPPPPEALTSEPEIPESIAEALRQLDPSFKAIGGKKSMGTRPHLFIPKRYRPMKASEQEDIPFTHFITGMAGMVLLSMLDDQSSPAAAACHHLHEAAEDHISRPWSTVRDWSKTMFDRLNLGEIAWDDYEEMQRERIKICFSAPPKVAIVVPCPHFSAGNCPQSACHDEGELSLRHICPFCYASGAGRQDHPIFKCNSKKAYTSAPRPQYSKQQFKPKVEQPPKN